MSFSCDTGGNLNGVLYKSLPSVVYLFMYPPSVARQQPGKNVNTATDKHAEMEESPDALFSVRSLSYQGAGIA
jgi:hypothetical protein